MRGAPLALLGAIACSREPAAHRDPPQSEPPTATTPPATLDLGEAPDHVSLPFATAGQIPGTATFTFEGPEPTIAVTGDFSVTRDGDDYTVAYTGPIDDPVIATGEATLTTAHDAWRIPLAAVLGDPDLPLPDWQTDAWGTSAIAPFPSAPFPDGDASVLVAVPPAFSDPGAVNVVTHLHGFSSVLDRTIPAQELVPQVAMSGRDAILVVPQGPYDEASGDFGQLEDDGGHARLVRDVVSVLYRDGLLERPAMGVQVLTSHSGGYAASTSLLDHGGLPFAGMYLYDSLYGYVPDFEAFALGGGLLLSTYTAYGGTVDRNAELLDSLLSDGIDVATDTRGDLLLTAEAAVAYSASAHSWVMTDGLAYARWLAAGPLPRGPGSAPELLSVVSDGVSATVSWREDRVPGGTVIVRDPDTFEELGSGESSPVVVPARARIELVGRDYRHGDGPPGDTYAGSGGSWLVVDGFHRVFGGSYGLPTHDFAARAGAALGGASTAVDDAVSEGTVDLRDWDHVLWLLGDESTADATFDAGAEAAIAAYLAGGGKLIVSGSELGFASSDAVLGVLGVSYVADDAGTDQAAGRAFGVVYPEDYPDVLASEATIWTYATGGGAAVGRDRQVVAVGFAVETMDDADLASGLAELVAWLDGS